VRDGARFFMTRNSTKHFYLRLKKPAHVSELKYMHTVLWKITTISPEANLSRAMRHINGVYTQRYNRLKKTDGALFRGRYKAILIDSDSYLFHLSKYIHCNPTKAKLVTELSEYLGLAIWLTLVKGKRHSG